jgi:cyclophilin family peptidyl-prolyl cis-trans isomerase
MSITNAFRCNSLALLATALTLTPAMTPVTTAAAQQQSVTPTLVGATPRAAAAPQLPPPLSRTEQRFRDFAKYIRDRGTIDEATREQVVKLAGEIDVELKAPTTARDQMLRLLPARAQIAIWLADEPAMDAAFEQLASISPASDMITMLWARELINSARFEKAVSVLNKHGFADVQQIDAKILLAQALIGITRFDEAQAALNSAPPLNRSPQQLNAIGGYSGRIPKLRDLWNRELVAIAKDQTRADLPTVQLATTRGPILVELFEDQAPNTVGNFIEHVDLGTYTGTKFHRVVRGFGVQGGDPSTANGGIGGSSTGGWTVPDECERGDRRATLAGRLVLAKQPAPDSPLKAAANSGGCQFMILLGPDENLDGMYTVFGRVIDGFDRARLLTPDDEIVSATVVQRRNHEYKGVRLGTDAIGNFAMPKPGTPARPDPGVEDPINPKSMVPEKDPSLAH